MDSSDYSINSSTSTSLSHVITKNLLSWAIFATGIFFYCYAYLMRIYPSVMQKDLLIHFHITASSFGVLSAFYYFAYAPMQLPVGFAVDRFGARRSLILASSISTFGIFIFVSSNYLALAELGRFMIGFGCAFAYVTVLKLATIWLPKKYFATATGVATGSGMLAGVFTYNYLPRIIQYHGYKTALYLCFIIGLVLTFLIISFVRDKKESHQQSKSDSDTQISLRKLGAYLILLAKNPQMWLIGLIGAFMYLPASVFLDAFGMPYLKDVYHLTAKQAGIGVSMTLAGWIIASPVIGVLSDLFRTRKIPILISTFLAAIIISIIFYLPGISGIILYFLLFIFGMSCAAHPLCFTLSKENNPIKISATSIAFANCLIMLGGVFFQPIVGKLLDVNWSGVLSHGLRVYSSSDYAVALSVLPIGLIFAGLLSLGIRETFHRAKK